MAHRFAFHNLFASRGSDEGLIHIFKAGTEELAKLFTDASEHEEAPNPVQADPLGSAAVFTNEPKVDVKYQVGTVGGPGASITRRDSVSVDDSVHKEPVPETSGLVTRAPDAGTFSEAAAEAAQVQPEQPVTEPAEAAPAPQPYAGPISPV